MPASTLPFGERSVYEESGTASCCRIFCFFVVNADDMSDLVLSDLCRVSVFLIDNVCQFAVYNCVEELLLDFSLFSFARINVLEKKLCCGDYDDVNMEGLFNSKTILRFMN